MAAEAAVSFAVKTLGNLLIEKAVFLRGVDGDVKWLRKELQRMQCFLKDATKKQSDSNGIRHWISEIREVAHDAQDAIDMFVLNIQSKGLQRRYTCFPNHIYHLNKVREEIKSIRKRLREIEESRQRYGIQDLGDHGRAKSRPELEVESHRRLAYWKNDKHLVGLEKDVELLLGKAVFEKTEGLSVAAILGMGGIGKSTLASKVYNHSAVGGAFGCRAWVVVSSEFTPEDVMKQILLQLGISPDELKLLESIDDQLGRRENLKRELHQRLKDKRYFIVLDDVWEAKHWECLSSAFPDEDNGSRLLLTSRNQVISMDSGYVHKMNVLDDNQSWELFLKKVFVDNTNDGCPKDLKNIAEEILRKCGGLPLAISVVGGLLATKPKYEREWEKVVKEMNHMDGRIRGDIDTISAILELSYQHLPLELKACFLCFGFFKEDAHIRVRDLEHIWAALGLVAQGEDQTMEDISREYLLELIGRNMVQVKEIEYDRVVFCHIHDLLRGLSIKKAREEINLEVVSEEGSSHLILDKPRHRAIHFFRPSLVSTTHRNQHLRSLFIHGSTKYNKDCGPSSYWKCFELLSVLDFGESRFEVLPKAIGVLVGLRYLRMRYKGKRSTLPCSWAKLKNLEVLDLRCYDMNIIINKVILKMDSLRHLYSDISHSKVPLGKMRNLRTLSLFPVNNSNLWQIQGMTGVSFLGFDMSGMSDACPLFTYLASLEDLDRLILFNGNPVNMAGLGALHRVTQLTLGNFSYMMSMPGDYPASLSHLTLSYLPRLDKDPMPVLEKLSKLLYLKLTRVTYGGEEMVISRDGFPSLKVLHLKHMDESINMKIEEGAMPELNQLIICDCPNLKIENLPEYLKYAIIDADEL